MKVFAVIFLLWIPLVLIRYPGIQSGGVSAQFQQIMGMDTLARRLSPVIYDGHYISGHHPVLLTFLFGMFIRIGAEAGNVDIGMFLLNCAVCIFNALGWAYIISSFYQYLNRREWFLLFICFSANPLIISLNTYVLKDNLFATLLSVYCIVIFRICQDGMTKRYKYQMLGISILLPFIKNQGIYIVALVNIILIFSIRNTIRAWIKNIVFSILIYGIIFSGVIMPLMKISPGGKQEMFSLFFQATAKTMLEHSDEIEKEEAEVITKILPIEEWSVYTPHKSDNIKFQFNQKATSTDLKDFFIVWIKIGFRRPKSYIKAILAQTYGYYNIDYETADLNWNGAEHPFTSNGDMISAPKWETLNQKITDFLSWCIHHEHFKYVFNIAVSFWLIAMCCLVYEGEKKNLLWIVPTGVQWLICLLSPVNGSGRYGMVIYEMAPFIAAYTFSTKTDDLQSKES